MKDPKPEPRQLLCSRCRCDIEHGHLCEGCRANLEIIEATRKAIDG